MNDIKNSISDLLEQHIIKIIISDATSSENEFKKIVIGRKERFFQAEKYTKTQVFHENIPFDALEGFILLYFGLSFRQLNAFTDTHEYNMKLSKKGKLFCGKSATVAPINHQLEHNRKKNYILEVGSVIEPLVDMGIFTKNNTVVKSMYDKYKQINRFVEMVDDSVNSLSLKKLNIIDFGCGKSYLTFILYHYFTKIKGIDVKMVGLDLKEEVIENCNMTAKKYGYDNLSFELGDINGYQCDFPVDMVISLHACDTATDFAIYNAIKWGAKLIFSVPCCQHELNAQIKTDDLSILTRYGIVKERVSALMTDAIRGNLLEYSGYKTQLLEFIDLSHTPKNILIRAQKSNISAKRKEQCLQETKKLTEEFNLKPTLMSLLGL